MKTLIGMFSWGQSGRLNRTELLWSWSYPPNWRFWRFLFLLVMMLSDDCTMISSLKGAPTVAEIKLNFLINSRRKSTLTPTTHMKCFLAVEPLAWRDIQQTHSAERQARFFASWTNLFVSSPTWRLKIDCRRPLKFTLWTFFWDSRELLERSLTFLSRWNRKQLNFVLFSKSFIKFWIFVW